MNKILDELTDGILNGDMDVAKEKVQSALAADLAPTAILDCMISAMAEVGHLFEEGEYFVPEMLIAARAMKEGLALLRPRLIAEDVKPAGKAVLGTVKGDLHDIGKNLVAMMLEGAGFEVVDLGADVDPAKFIDVIRTQDVDIVGMSALLTTTMPSMKVTLDALEKAELRDCVKVMIGGAPVTEDYAAEIGADGYASDASRAVTVAKALMA